MADEDHVLASDPTGPRGAHPAGLSLPVGGRLQHFGLQWEMIKPGPWVLETILRGYAIEFSSPPPVLGRTRHTQTPTDPAQRDAIEAEVDGLLQKDAIEQVESPEPTDLYQCSFF